MLFIGKRPLREASLARMLGGIPKRPIWTDVFAAFGAGYHVGAVGRVSGDRE
jgi:hypothetical protein